MKKHLFYFAIFWVGLLFVTGAGTALAEVSLPDFSKTEKLPDFISSIYSFALTVVGIAVFIRILHAGFLMLTAAGNASKWGDARTKMQNAVIGAILLFAAYLILYVINPDLVSNAFKFTVPGTGQPSAPAATGANTAGPTVSQLSVSGLPKGSGATSFHGLPIARAQEGIYVFTIKVTDRNGDVCRETYSMEVLSLVAVRSNTDLYAKNSVPRKHSSVLLAAANAQEEGEPEEIIEKGGCVITTDMVPDAIVGVPYYAEIYAAGEAPFMYEIEEGSLPAGLSIVAALDMPILTIKNMTAQRTPLTAFKAGDTFRLELTNGKPNSPVYFKWFKNGAPWFYPGITPNSAGWSRYAETDANGGWVNEAAFTANEIGVWQEYAMVDGKVSKVIEFQVLAPEVKIVVSAPAPGTVAPVYGGGGGCVQTPFRCENKETGAISDLLTEDEIRTCSADKSGDIRLVWPECRYSEHAANYAKCDQYNFEARNCLEQSSELRGEENVMPISVVEVLPHSADGNPPTDVSAGSLYTTDQYSGDIRLGGNNLVVRCRYSDQVAAVSCGAMSSGEHCLPDGRNAGWNETWCAGKTDASGRIINPPAKKE
jgi:hypothetical protein